MSVINVKHRKICLSRRHNYCRTSLYEVYKNVELIDAENKKVVTKEGTVEIRADDK